MTQATWDAVLVSLRISAAATLLAMTFAVPGGYLLARREFVGKRWVSALLVVSLALPPTAVGYLLLVILGDTGWLGRDTLGFDLGLLFTWRGATLAAAIMAFPLVFRTARVTFEGIDPRLEAMSRTLGRGPVATFLRVTLPLGSRGLLAAALLGFMRSLGEFGATIMIAGNIAGKTQTLSLAIYGAQQAGHDGEAQALLAVAAIVGLVSVFAAEGLSAPPQWSKTRSPFSRRHA